MKKIAIITSNLADIFNGGAAFGGGYVVTKNFISELLKLNDIKLTILTEKNSKIDMTNADIIEIPSSIYNPKFKKEVEKFFENNKFDMIISANTYYIFQNYLLQCHSYAHRAGNIFSLFRPVKKFLGRKKIKEQNELFKHCDKNNNFIAVSEVIKNDYSKNFNINPDNIAVIHPACKQIYENLPEIKQNNKVTFGVVANSSVNKRGHYFLLAAGFAKLAGLKFNIKIIAPKYAKDILMQGIIKLFNMSKQVEILPIQHDMTYFYSNIDFLVLPSMNEAFGLVALEAMSYAKVPIVSSSVGACDIITENNGFIFNCHSFVSLVNILKKVGKLYYKNFEYYQKIAENAFNTSKKYTWKTFVLNIINKF